VSRLLRVKLRRDLRATWSRLLLMVIAIAVSLTVFGGVLSAYTAIGRETTNAYMGTEPASATIVLDKDVDVAAMARMVRQARTRPGVIEAAGRSQFSSEVKVDGKLRDIPLQVFVAPPDDPMRMANFRVERGVWPPAPGEIYIGRDGLDLLGVAVGDRITITPETGQPIDLRVADTVYDPSLSPSPQEQTGRAYLSTTSLAEPPEAEHKAGDTHGTGLDQLKIQVADEGQTAPSRDRDRIVAVAGDVGAWLEDTYGVKVREIQVPTPYAHPHQWQADALLLSLLAGGAIALLLSTILVANMLNTLFTQQIPQIGIMKAIGAGSGSIGRFYLVMTLVIAAAATVVALPLAMMIGRFGVARFSAFLGIEPVSLASPLWAYLVIVLIGLAVPPLMALVPLVRTARTTVRAAIDHHGGGTKPGSATGLMARLSRLRRFDRGLLMALRNTVRRPARFWLSVGLLASAGMVFVAGMSLGSGVSAIDEDKQASRTWDVDVQLAAPAAVDEITGIVAKVPGVRAAEPWNRTQTGVAGPGRMPLTRTYPDQGHGGISVTAVPAGTTMLPPPTLLEGRWLNPDETGAVVLNQITRNNTIPDVEPGDDVQLIIGGKTITWRVVGLVEERGAGAGGVYVTARGFAEATGQPQRANQLRIATNKHDERTRQSVAEAVGRELSSAGFEVQTAASVSRSDAISAGHLGPLIAIVLIVAIAMGVVGAIGLASAMSANILDRTREFGVMHAIGAQPKKVRGIVVAEGLFLALTSCLVAILPALLLTGLLGTGLGNLFMNAPLPYRISLLSVGIWVVVAILGAALATDAAATRASKITVREALAYV
jgi:putative ABC transport system permease protein